MTLLEPWPVSYQMDGTSSKYTRGVDRSGGSSSDACRHERSPGRHWVSALRSITWPIARMMHWYSEDSLLEIYNASMSFHQSVRSIRITLSSLSCILSSELNIEILLASKCATFGVRTWVFSLLVATGWTDSMFVARCPHHAIVPRWFQASSDWQFPSWSLIHCH